LLEDQQPSGLQEKVDCKICFRKSLNSQIYYGGNWVPDFGKQ